MIPGHNHIFFQVLTKRNWHPNFTQNRTIPWTRPHKRWLAHTYICINIRVKVFALRESLKSDTEASLCLTLQIWRVCRSTSLPWHTSLTFALIDCSFSAVQLYTNVLKPPMYLIVSWILNCARFCSVIISTHLCYHKKFLDLLIIAVSQHERLSAFKKTRTNQPRNWLSVHHFEQTSLAFRFRISPPYSYRVWFSHAYKLWIYMRSWYFEYTNCKTPRFCEHSWTKAYCWYARKLSMHERKAEFVFPVLHGEGVSRKATFIGWKTLINLSVRLGHWIKEFTDQQQQ